MCPTGTSLRLASGGKADLRSAFEVMDVDRDGRISRDDLKSFYGGRISTTSTSSSAGDDVIGTMMRAADSNEDGYVEYDEFERVLEGRNGKKKKDDGVGVMEAAFRVMDRDGDGKVGHGDLKSYLSWAGFQASDEDIKAMIRLGGGDETGGVTYDGLLKILAL